jgi:hypothetical protein
VEHSKHDLLDDLNALTNKVGRAIHDPRLSEEERNELHKAHHALAVAAFDFMRRSNAQETAAKL